MRYLRVRTRERRLEQRAELWVDGLAPLHLLFPVAWMLHWGSVLREEQYLRAKFAASHVAYRRQVRWWLWRDVGGA